MIVRPEGVTVFVAKCTCAPFVSDEDSCDAGSSVPPTMTEGLHEGLHGDLANQRRDSRNQRRHLPSRVVIDIAAQGSERELAELLTRSPGCVTAYSHWDLNTSHADSSLSMLGCCQDLQWHQGHSRAWERSKAQPTLKAKSCFKHVY